jgi:hypothetical protein
VKRVCIAVILLGLVLGQGAYLRFKSAGETIVDGPLRADAGEYFAYAYNLRFKHTYSKDKHNLADLNSPPTPDGVRSPGYPVFLTMFVDGLPDRPMINRIVIAQTLLSILALTLCYFIFRSFLPWLWAAIGCQLVAMSPHLVVVNSFVLTESLFGVTLVLVALAMSLFIRRPSLWMAAMVGLAIGVANHVRPGLQYFPIFLFFFLVYQVLEGPQRWRMGIWMLAGFLLVLSPWLVRNTITLHTPSSSSHIIGFVHHGMYPNFMYDNQEKSYGYPYRFDPRVNEIGSSLSSVFAELGRRFREQPYEHLKWFLLGKPVVLWNWNDVQSAGDVFTYPVLTSPYFTEGYFQFTHAIMLKFHGLTVLLMFVGCVMAWIPSSTTNLSKDTLLMARFMSLMLIYFVLVHMIGFPIPRYSVPLRPFQFAMACFAPYGLYAIIRSRSLRTMHNNLEHPNTT